MINFFTISSSVSIADFGQVNVCWAIFSCSSEKDEAKKKKKKIGDSMKQLLKTRNISLCYTFFHELLDYFLVLYLYLKGRYLCEKEFVRKKKVQMTSDN